MVFSDLVDGFSAPQWQFLFAEAVRAPGYLKDMIAESDYARARLASDLPQELLQHQLTLQSKSKRKFSDPTAWLWTTRLLELSSDETTAKLVASYYPDDCKILDVGCGGGSDAIALAAKHNVVALDRSDFATGMTMANAALQECEGTFPRLSVRCADISDEPIPEDVYIHADPDRRSEKGRSVQLQWHSPDIDTILRLMRTSAGGSIKLAPACVDVLPEIDSQIAKHWITHNRSVVQQRWWWNVPGFEHNYVYVSTHSKTTGWHHWSVSRDELESFASPHQNLVVCGSVEEVGEWIGDADPSLRAAKCQHVFAFQSGHQVIGNHDGFLTTVEPKEGPFVRWHQVLEVSPLDAKKIKRKVSDYACDGIILKTRNVHSVPEELTKASLRSSTNPLVVFATRIGKRHYGILTKNS